MITGVNKTHKTIEIYFDEADVNYGHYLQYQSKKSLLITDGITIR